MPGSHPRQADSRQAQSCRGFCIPGGPRGPPGGVGFLREPGQWQEADGLMFALQKVLGPGEELPQAFEASEKWPNLIHEPLDQGNCAGSWAFSTAGASWGWCERARRAGLTAP